MSRKKQIRKVSKQRQEYLKFKPFADDLRKAESWCELDGVLNRYQTVKNLTKMGYRKAKWISIKERLPEEKQSVLVFAKNEIYALLYEGNDKWWGEEGWSTTEKWGITHWMPLPEPPAEREGKK